MAINRMYALGRLKTGEMNKTEKEFADFLQKELDAHKIHSYQFEAVTLKLADNCRYTPDFFVHNLDGYMTFYEVKGFWQDDARVKIKVASEKFPMFRFVAVKKVKAKDRLLTGKHWEYEEF